MMSSARYPWQEQVWKRLLADKNKLHHALLLRGRHGIGKLDFAITLAKSLLCEHPNQQGQACGQCSSCGWFDQDNHPDFRLLTPEQESSKDEEGAKPSKKKTQILIEQIRELSDFLALSSHKSDGLRIVLINPAEGLNQASGNALLKMLEEPPPNVMFIMVAHQPQKILPTIMSRCQKVDMPVPSRQESLDWMAKHGIAQAEEMLDYAGGSPLQVLNDEEGAALYSSSMIKQLAMGGQLDIFQAAGACLELGMENAITALQKWCYDLILCRMTHQARYHVAQSLTLKKLAQGLKLASLIDFIKMLADAKKSANHPLNNELQLERLLHHYTQIF